jgi:arylsulfatase
MVPRIQRRSYAIEADLVIPDGGAEGVIVANADFIGGFALWVDDTGLLTHAYSFLGVETYKQTATKPLPAGEVTVKMLFEADETKPGSGGRCPPSAATRRRGSPRYVSGVGSESAHRGHHGPRHGGAHHPVNTNARSSDVNQSKE